MTDSVAETIGNGAAPAKTRITPNVANMVKTNGSQHKDDVVGNALAGLKIDEVKEIAEEMGLDSAKYDHLNVGQQRMNLGNGLRRLAKSEEGAETLVALSDKVRALRPVVNPASSVSAEAEAA
jgi:hypothetical protein